MRKLVLSVALLHVCGAAMAQMGVNQKLADPNLADAAELSAMPHMNADVAAAVVAGRPYLTAYCHIDCIEKTYRLDRIREFRVEE